MGLRGAGRRRFRHGRARRRRNRLGLGFGENRLSGARLDRAGTALHRLDDDRIGAAMRETLLDDARLDRTLQRKGLAPADRQLLVARVVIVRHSLSVVLITRSRQPGRATLARTGPVIPARPHAALTTSKRTRHGVRIRSGIGKVRSASGS